MILQIISKERFEKKFGNWHSAYDGMLFEVYASAKIGQDIVFLLLKQMSVFTLRIEAGELESVGINIIDPRIPFSWSNRTYSPPLEIADKYEINKMMLNELRSTDAILDRPEILLQFRFKYDDTESYFLEHSFKTVSDDFGSYMVPIDWIIEFDDTGYSKIIRCYTSGNEVQLVEFEFDIRNSKKIINHPLTGELVVEEVIDEVAFGNGCIFKVLKTSQGGIESQHSIVQLRLDSLGKMLLQVAPHIDSSILMNLAESFKAN